jgi:hypothetical protein
MVGVNECYRLITEIESELPVIRSETVNASHR